MMQTTDDRSRPDARPQIERQIRGFGRQTFWVGILLALLGVIGIALPPVLAITTVELASLLLLLGGGFWIWHAWRHQGGVASWLKPLLAVTAGVLMIVNPVAGAAALALLLSYYLLLDAFGSFALARDLRRAPGWVWMLVNGLVDVALVLLLTFTWPASSLVVVGVFVGVSLLFDGAALMAIGWSLRKA